MPRPPSITHKLLKCIQMTTKKGLVSYIALLWFHFLIYFCNDIVPDFLKIALEAMWRRGAPLRETLPFIDRIIQSISVMVNVWQYSNSQPERDKSLHQAIWYAEEARKGLKENKWTLDDQAAPVSLIQSASYEAHADLCTTSYGSNCNHRMKWLTTRETQTLPLRTRNNWLRSGEQL